MGAEEEKQKDEGKLTKEQAEANQNQADEDDEDEADEEPSAEDLKAEIKRIRTALKKANTEARNLRQAAKGGSGDDKEKASQANSEVAELKKELRQRDAVAALLATEGFNGNAKAATRAVRSFASLDPEDLDQEIEDYKTDNPAMFKKRKRLESPDGVQRSSGSNRDADKDGGGGALSEASRKMLRMTGH